MRSYLQLFLVLFALLRIELKSKILEERKNAHILSDLFDLLVIRQNARFP